MTEAEVTEKTIACVKAASPYDREVGASTDLFHDLAYTSLSILDLTFELERAFQKQIDLKGLAQKSGGKQLLVSEITHTVRKALGGP